MPATIRPIDPGLTTVTVSPNRTMPSKAVPIPVQIA